MSKRKRFSFFDDDFDPFADVDQIHALFEDLMRQNLRLHDFHDRPGQNNPPLVYGFSMRVGPDGKPHFEQFGNVQRGKLRKEREPLVDVINGPADIRVLIELPGVDKKNLHMHANKGLLQVDVSDPERPFSKQIRLPDGTQEKTAKASYKNGILEVTFRKKPTSGDEIPVK